MYCKSLLVLAVVWSVLAARAMASDGVVGEALLANDPVSVSIYRELAEACGGSTVKQPQQTIVKLAGFMDMWPGYHYDYRIPAEQGGGGTLVWCFAKAIRSLEDQQRPAAEQGIQPWLVLLQTQPKWRLEALEAAYLCAIEAEQASLKPDIGRTQARLDAYIDSLRAHYPPGSKHANLGSNEIARAQTNYLEFLMEFDMAAAGERLQRLLQDPEPIIAERAAGLMSQYQLRSTPMQLSFAALDGRKVDLAKLRGKVVLVDFTAVTWCQGCRIQEVFLKAAYEKYHAQGFEIIAITNEAASQPDDKQARIAFMVRLLRERNIEWPHYFDGKGMGNPYIKQYGISAFPSHFLLDKNGLLVTTKARGPELDKYVRRLLGLAGTARYR
jgi:peroxiredoxin